MSDWEQAMYSEQRRFEDEDLERRIQKMQRDVTRGCKILETEFKAVNPWKETETKGEV